MGNTVYCIASTETQADTVLTELRNLGFSPADISVVLPDHADTKNIGVEPDVIRGAETGGLAGGILGWLAGISALAIPGVGAFLIAGPLIAAFGGAVAGGVVGGLAGGTGAVHPLGLPKDVSSYIEDRLRRGDILISVHSDDSVSRERAVAVFKAAGANDIYYHDDQAAA
jgi:hypothetical protein